MRVGHEIDPRKRSGRFGAKELTVLLGDNSQRQSEDDLAAIRAHRWEAIGFERLLQYVEALGLDVDSIFLPIEQPTRRPIQAALEKVTP